ncbi:hypothetical protein NC651_016302 [Populus alba x Populus x berolinensis]|nr:hypothetical protein NC651_016302 [Populus alba x Populus x berolinensis]
MSWMRLSMRKSRELQDGSGAGVSFKVHPGEDSDGGL